MAEEKQQTNNCYILISKTTKKTQKNEDKF